MKSTPPHILLLLLITFLGVFGTAAYAQDKAEKYIQQTRYADAALLLEKEVRKHPENGQAHERLAYVYRRLQRYDDAEIHYARADTIGTLGNIGRLQYGQTLLKNGKKTEAQFQFEQYVKAEPESFVARLMLQSLYEVNGWAALPNAFEVRSLSGINSPYSDFAPVVYDSGIVFTTDRNQDLVNENTSGSNNQPYLAVFFARFEDEGGRVLSKPKSFLNRLSGDYHIGPVNIDTVNQLIYYSEVRNTLDKNEVSRIKTYVAYIHKGKRIIDGYALPINSDSFSVAHPAITPDGKTLFFASDMPGTEGGMDLYYIRRTIDGWSSPLPVSDNLNTPMNEVFPYAPDENTLYFASNGHTGYGGLDIYLSRFENGSWSMPINLKAPINTEGDDFGICFQNKSRGYFSSDRDGGMGKDDIYQFVQLAQPDEIERVKVVGVFEYRKIPPEGVMLRLLDEEDNLLEEVWTDSLGNFLFSALPANREYRIEVVGATPEMLDEAKIYLLNEDGQKVTLLDRMKENQFAFITLPKEEFESLPLADENDRRLGTYEIFGQLYTALPRDDYSGITLQVYDDEGNLVNSIVTDSLGLYTLGRLQKDERYTISPGSNDSAIYRSSVFFEDADGIREITTQENSFFLLEQIVAQKLDEAANHVPTRGYVLHDDRPVPRIRLMLIDSMQQNLRAAKTDSSGYFDFGKIAGNKSFEIILPDSIASLPGSTIIYLIDKDGNRMVHASAKTRQLYAFKTLRPEEFDPQLEAAADSRLKRYEIYGQVFRKLPGDYGDGLEIIALGEDGTVIEVVRADSSGNFKFTKLRPDQHYTFRVDEEDAGGLNVSIYDTDGNLIERLRLDELAAYVYEKLNREEVDLAMEDTAGYAGRLDADLVAGQIYKKLPGDYKSGVLVYAMDDQGNVLDSAYTDGKGNFRFERLNRDENFTLRVMDSEDKAMNVAFTNFEGHIRGSALLDSTNTFTYSKIILEAAGDLGPLSEEDSKSHKLYGQVYEKLPGDYRTGMKVYAVDESGKIIDVAELDESGKFVFTRLEKDANYIFKLEEDDGSLNVALLDEEGNPVNEMTPSAGGVFAYNKLTRDGYTTALLAENDTKLPGQEPKTGKSPAAIATGETMLYFGYRESHLSGNDSAALEAIVKTMIADDGRHLMVTSHADRSESSGQRSYSALRSVSIAGYVHKRGIPLDRVHFQNLEYFQPIVDCPEGTPCTAEQRAQNQRSVLRIVPAEQLPPAPDHVLLYEFNEWRLPADGNKAVFGLVKLLKENPGWTVQLDGYTDTWGPYEANSRISELRVQNIYHILLNNGIPENRIEMKWHGETIPLGDAKLMYPCPVEGRKENRRVEIRILK